MHPIIWTSIAFLTVIGLYIFAKTLSRESVLIAATVFVIGAAYYQLNTQIPDDDISRYVFRARAFEGVVASDPETSEDKIRLICRVKRVQIHCEWRYASGLVMLNLYPGKDGNAPKLEYGDRVRISAVPYPPRDPTNPGQFSWRQYLARQNIYSCAYASASQVRILNGASGNIFVSAALRAKHYIVKSIYRITPEREASVIAGMVLGTYSYLPRQTLANFGKTGTMHLLAASGFNCYIILLLATPLLRRIKIMPKGRNIIIIILVIAYLFMVGPKPSLVRASLIAIFYMLAPLFKKTPNIRVLFFATGLVVLAINPSYLFDVGFQLSFLAVWALISIAPVVESLLAHAGLVPAKCKNQASRPAWLRKISTEIAGAGIATLSVTVFTAPVIAYYFNYFSLVSLPANMALALGVPLVFAAGMLAPVFAPIPIIGGLVGWLGTIVTKGMLAVVDYLGSWDHSSIAVSSPGLLAIAGYYLILYVALSYVRSDIEK
ncbi:MAG: ComEC/Rec2 family competence protein [Armatimonadota bacterium]